MGRRGEMGEEHRQQENENGRADYQGWKAKPLRMQDRQSALQIGKRWGAVVERDHPKSSAEDFGGEFKYGDRDRHDHSGPRQG